MAEKNKTVNLPVYGSLAYDFETAVPVPEWEREAPRRDDRKIVIPAPPSTVEHVNTRTKARPKQTVSPFSVIGFACAAVLLVFTLLAHIQLTIVTDQTAELEASLEELQLSQSRLLIEHESVFNRTEIEEYAINVLGMQRPRAEQIIYLNSSAPDKAVVLESDEGKYSFLDRISEIFSLISEYF